jgi:hypothetical protein
MILSEQEIDDIARDWFINLPTGYDMKWAIIKSHRAQANLIAEMRQMLTDHGLGWHFETDNPPPKDKGQIEAAAELSNSQAT